MIKFETTFNADVAAQMNKHTIKKMWWLYLLLSLLFVVIGALSFVGEERDVVFGVIMIAVGVLFFPLCLWFTNIAQKKINNSMSIMGDDTLQTVIFDADKVTIRDEKGDDYRAEVVAKYTYFYRVEESETHYFLYISKAQAHIVAKSGLVEGSLEELNEILAKNLGENFKQHKKQNV